MQIKRRNHFSQSARDHVAVRSFVALFDFRFCFVLLISSVMSVLATVTPFAIFASKKASSTSRFIDENTIFHKQMHTDFSFIRKYGNWRRELRSCREHKRTHTRIQTLEMLSCRLDTSLGVQRIDRELQPPKVKCSQKSRECERDIADDEREKSKCDRQFVLLFALALLSLFFAFEESKIKNKTEKKVFARAICSSFCGFLALVSSGRRPRICKIKILRI